MSDRNFREESMRSETAFKIISTIAKDKATHTSGIADNLNSSYHSLRKYVKALNEIGILVKGEKEGRKQHYELSMYGLVEKMFELWVEKVDEYDNLLSERLENMENKDEFKDLESLRKEYSDEKFFLVHRFYLDNYLASVEDSTIEKMMIEDFALANLFWFEKSDYTEIGDIPESIIHFSKHYTIPFLMTNEGVNAFDADEFQEIISD
ncbi:MAG: hypothetical protein ABEJ36_02915 [Candidatus Nanosalina sp.]